MAGEKPIRVAIIGLGFGAEFIPIYQHTPARKSTRSAAATARGSMNAPDGTESKKDLPTFVISSKTRTSTPSTSIRRSPIMPGCRSRP